MPTTGAVMMALASLPLAYLAGSIPCGYLVARMRGVDIMTAGSCNPGATNVGRVCGRRWGILVFILDALKGFLAAGPLPWAMLKAGDVPIDSQLALLLPPLCAVAVFAGHSCSVFLGFRGGKGVASGAGALLAIAPVPLATGLLVWATVLFASRYMSLASMSGATTTATVCTVRAWRSERLEAEWPIWGLTVVLALLVIFRHRSNIGRMLHGQELKLGAGHAAEGNGK